MRVSFDFFETSFLFVWSGNLELARVRKGDHVFHDPFDVRLPDAYRLQNLFPEILICGRKLWDDFMFRDKPKFRSCEYLVSNTTLRGILCPKKKMGTL